MKIVVDTSVFISALISPKGIIAELLMNPIFKFEKYSSYYLLKPNSVISYYSVI